MCHSSSQFLQHRNPFQRQPLLILRPASGCPRMASVNADKLKQLAAVSPQPFQAQRESVGHHSFPLEHLC
jgi:hypothetical protein